MCAYGTNEVVYVYLRRGRQFVLICLCFPFHVTGINKAGRVEIAGVVSAVCVFPAAL